MRALLWRVLWGTAFRIWSPGYTVTGDIPQGPVMFAANHNSHADTAATQLALARAGHTRVLAAGAEDYFFRSRLTSLLSTAIGVFPFPRSGMEGVDRAISLLNSGVSILLYPQGTRDGGPFRPGAAHIAANGMAVVPVTIVGTARVLPKGAFWPRGGRVSLHFGSPLVRGRHETPEDFTARLESAVMREVHFAAAA